MQAYVDYLMIITPPESVINEISRYKRASVNLIGHFEGMYSRANIAITQQSRCKPFLAQPAITKMEQRIVTVPPIELALNAFAFVSKSSSTLTIYASFKQTTQTQNWFKLLTRQMDIKIKNFVPQIPIVQNIPATAFKKLLPKFEHLVLYETFTVNSLTVLHRETYAEYCEWRVYKELFFANRLNTVF
jgi:hypothetical protein